jgi:hypothetical protein
MMYRIEYASVEKRRTENIVERKGMGATYHFQANPPQRTASEQCGIVPSPNNVDNGIDCLIRTPQVEMMSRLGFIFEWNQEVFGHMERSIDIPYTDNRCIVAFDPDVVRWWLIWSVVD